MLKVAKVPVEAGVSEILKGWGQRPFRRLEREVCTQER